MRSGWKGLAGREGAGGVGTVCEIYKLENPEHDGGRAGVKTCAASRRMARLAWVPGRITVPCLQSGIDAGGIVSNAIHAAQVRKGPTFFGLWPVLHI
jgi:hypothetical protein